LVVTAGDIVHPVLVVEIPANCFLNAFLELEAGLPSEFTLEFGGVDGIASIVSQTVGDVGDEVHVLVFLATQQTVYCADNYLDDINVLPFVETSDVVGFGYLTIMEDNINGTCMILYKQPVTYVLSLAVNREWLLVADVVDEERNQFFGELIGAVVVRAVGDDSRHSVGVVEGTYEVVA